jgi:predicted nucleic acid-binding protein
VTRTLLDTSVVIASPESFSLGPADTAAISVITLGELRAGVALAGDPTARSLRQARLAAVRNAFEPLTVDESIAEFYGDVLATARSQKRPTKATDLIIIATAAATGRTLRTLDDAQASLARLVGVPVNP